MQDYLVWFFTLLVIPVIIAKADILHRALDLKQLQKIKAIYSWWNKENMPRNLRGASLFLNECDLSTQTPIPLHGRVDQVFKTKSNTLIPVDTKTRKSFSIYKSDIIQLSVYQVILKQKYGVKYKVSNVGYVRVVVQSGVNEIIRYIPVKLITEKHISNLWRRYNAIKRGVVETKCTCNGHFH
ncbi:PD-(D/E)XK nuclease family protein [Pseudoalteromonas sp. TAB23]|uniref:PD-(D/E)XK nuclease family protein n=1 Tax=Pseudoalteromonas sp. TAB23 TaxID=1938595 RepID=UPI00041EBAE2|nr:PD-(D/E)XK nuclease family protein [Pseudoalteromonas sp. TAB23]